MAGLIPAIRVLPRLLKDVDARHKAGHDERDNTILSITPLLRVTAAGEWRRRAPAAAIAARVRPAWPRIGRTIRPRRASNADSASAPGRRRPRSFRRLCSRT